jgi:hypothetical protein
LLRRAADFARFPAAGAPVKPTFAAVAWPLSREARVDPATVRPGVLGQAALALADGFARVLMEKGLISEAEYRRGFDLAVEAWAKAEGHPQQADVLEALERIHPGPSVAPSS